MLFGTVKIEGANQLLKKLERLPAKCQRKVYSQAVRAGGKVVLDAAKAKAPVDTGTLRRSLVLRTTPRKKRGEISYSVFPSTKKEPGLIGKTKAEMVGSRGGGRTSRGGRRGGHKGADYYYPAALEYGTSRMSAKPFMRPAWDSTRGRALKAILGRLRIGIEREAKK